MAATLTTIGEQVFKREWQLFTGIESTETQAPAESGARSSIPAPAKTTHALPTPLVVVHADGSETTRIDRVDYVKVHEGYNRRERRQLDALARGARPGKGRTRLGKLRPGPSPLVAPDAVLEMRQRKIDKALTKALHKAGRIARPAVAE